MSGGITSAEGARKWLALCLALTAVASLIKLEISFGKSPSANLIW